MYSNPGGGSPPAPRLTGSIHVSLLPVSSNIYPNVTVDIQHRIPSLSYWGTHLVWYAVHDHGTGVQLARGMREAVALSSIGTRPSTRGYWKVAGCALEHAPRRELSGERRCAHRREGIEKGEEEKWWEGPQGRRAQHPPAYPKLASEKYPSRMLSDGSEGLYVQ